MQLVSLNVGLPRLLTWQGDTFETGIFKDPIDGRIPLRTTNLDGDRQADLTVHGGPYKAVYGYPSEHYPAWNAELPHPVGTWGAFGENFTTTGMSESTVSRVTTNKFVHTPQGIYELKYFFNSSIGRVGGGEDLASEAVKNGLRQLIATENRSNPHSDQRLVELMRQQGVEIARRTVAKYREVLGILPSSKRRRYF